MLIWLIVVDKVKEILGRRDAEFCQNVHRSLMQS